MNRPQNAPPRSKVFLEGRYRKLTRDLPQTIFWCPKCKGHPRRRKGCEQCEGFGKLTRDSVQELLGWVIGKAFGTRKHKFHGAGREDLDVRMLGRGRPFVLELIDPKVSEVDLAACEAMVNDRNEGRMEVEGLHWTEKERVRVIKEGKYAKRYRALVEVDGEVDPARLAELVGDRLTLKQNTPARVAHRRADMVRERWMEFSSLELTDEGRVEAVIVSEHGTYLKEAISGEDERTTPNLSGLLGSQARCVELDVLAILDEEGEEPPAPAERPQRPSFGDGLGE
ncbi:MAG: tRNA pseudouridine(54/55) synthase Pus10 [Planctomycetota bacterium]|nr:tRNA pseudouridine(54/55) synthase Pus10 [Planctomycetota bacterium]